MSAACARRCRSCLFRMEILDTGCLRSEVPKVSQRMMQRTSGCAADSAAHTGTSIFPVLTVSDLLLNLRRAPGPAAPAARQQGRPMNQSRRLQPD